MSFRLLFCLFHFGAVIISFGTIRYLFFQLTTIRLVDFGRIHWQNGGVKKD